MMVATLGFSPQHGTENSLCQPEMERRPSRSKGKRVLLRMREKLYELRSKKACLSIRLKLEDISQSRSALSASKL